MFSTRYRNKANPNAASPPAKYNAIFLVMTLAIFGGIVGKHRNHAGGRYKPFYEFVILKFSRKF
ncbi:hypothetical protein BVJ53_04680 [Lacticaseibacillus chiayiensis]|uniref:Uncharacterized protein n=1 Tax=Lacticaseibacillus chiayiensis TaxID=2100821 RepID=A0A4Q1U5Z4_9LACO|nr:hypothetical protein BVJ53_04680 [Lacticaseibacillus chiayiensis]